MAQTREETGAKPRIFLVGPMGAGKTTIGQHLARRLKLDFFDSDREIEHRTGVTIPLIFELEGEQGFRDRESAMIDELTQLEGVVVATGGGAVLREQNRRHLHERGTVIYLSAPVSQLVERTTGSRNRPLLQVDDPAQKLEQLMTEREPLYRDVAHITLDTHRRTVRTIVGRLLKLLNPAATPPRHTPGRVRDSRA